MPQTKDIHRRDGGQGCGTWVASNIQSKMQTGSEGVKVMEVLVDNLSSAGRNLPNCSRVSPERRNLLPRQKVPEFRLQNFDPIRFRRDFGVNDRFLAQTFKGMPWELEKDAQPEMKR
jgi:hypothetical protein